MISFWEGDAETKTRAKVDAEVEGVAEECSSKEKRGRKGPGEGHEAEDRRKFRSAKQVRILISCPDVSNVPGDQLILN